MQPLPPPRPLQPGAETITLTKLAVEELVHPSNVGNKERRWPRRLWKALALEDAAEKTDIMRCDIIARVNKARKIPGDLLPRLIIVRNAALREDQAAKAAVFNAYCDLDRTEQKTFWRLDRKKTHRRFFGPV